jgi:hypothetical protein
VRVGAGAIRGRVGAGAAAGGRALRAVPPAAGGQQFLPARSLSRQRHRALRLIPLSEHRHRLCGG